MDKTSAAITLKRQLMVVAIAWFLIFACSLVFAVATNNFSFDGSDRGKPFGVYHPPWEAAKYNLGNETFGVFEGVSFLALPLLLLVARKIVRPIKGMPVAPWLVMSASVLFAVYIWPFGLGGTIRVSDPTLESELLDLIRFQLPMITGFIGTMYLLAHKAHGIATTDTPD